MAFNLASAYKSATKAFQTMGANLAKAITSAPKQTAAVGMASWPQSSVPTVSIAKAQQNQATKVATQYSNARQAQSLASAPAGFSPLQGGDIAKATTISPTAPLRSSTSGSATTYTPQSFVSPGIADVPYAPSTISSGTSFSPLGGSTLAGSGGGTSGGAISTGLAIPSYGQQVTDSMGRVGTALFNPNTGERLVDPSATDTETGGLEAVLKKYMPQKESVLQNPDYIAAQNQYDQARQRAMTLNNQITEIRNRADAAALSTIGQGRGIPEAIIGGQQAEIYREAAIQSLPIQSQLAFAQGDVESAKENLTRLSAVLTEEANNKFEYQKTVASAVIGFATDVEKSKIQSLLDQKKTFATEQSKIYGMLAQNNAPPTVWEAARSAKSIEQLYAAVGRYGTDILETQLKQAQIASANRANQTAITGSGTLTGKPQTQAQVVAQGYAQRAAEADQTITNLGAQFTGAASYFGQVLPNIFNSPDRQQYEQAERNFVNAVLRPESGAVISEAEFKNAAQQYFPQPGDGQAVIAQKAQNRQTKIDALYRAANVNQPATPGAIIEDVGGKRYVVGADGETLTEI